jgi:hypothetical protein
LYAGMATTTLCSAGVWTDRTSCILADRIDITRRIRSVRNGIAHTG